MRRARLSIKEKSAKIIWETVATKEATRFLESTITSKRVRRARVGRKRFLRLSV